MLLSPTPTDLLSSWHSLTSSSTDPYIALLVSTMSNIDALKLSIRCVVSGADGHGARTVSSTLQRQADETNSDSPARAPRMLSTFPRGCRRLKLEPECELDIVKWDGGVVGGWKPGRRSFRGEVSSSWGSSLAPCRRSCPVLARALPPSEAT